MPIEFACPRCSAPVRAADRSAGRPGMCPTCEAIVDIPGKSTSGHRPAEGVGAFAATQPLIRTQRVFSALGLCLHVGHLGLGLALGYCLSVTRTTLRLAADGSVFWSRPVFELLAVSAVLILSWCVGRGLLAVLRLTVESWVATALSVERLATSRGASPACGETGISAAIESAKDITRGDATRP